MNTITGFCMSFSGNLENYGIGEPGRAARILARLAAKAFGKKVMGLEESGFLTKFDIGCIVLNDMLLRSYTLDSDEFAALLEDEIEFMGDAFRPTKPDYMTAWKIIKWAALETAFPYGTGIRV